MSFVSGAELWHVGLLAEGFPADICPAEVARTVSSTTGAAVDKIAPLAGHDKISTGWLLLLHSHDEQKRCLHNHRTLHFQSGKGPLPVRLNLPQVIEGQTKLNWITVNKEEERMDSVASAGLFGDGDENTELTDPKQIWKDHRPTGSDDAHNNLPPGLYGQPGPPQNKGQGPVFYGQMSPPGPLFHHQNLEPSMGYPQQVFPGYPGGYGRGRGRGMMNSYMQQQGQQFDPQGTYGGVPRCDSNPVYPATGPLPTQYGTGGPPQRVGGLNLKREPFPYQDTYEDQPENYYDDNMMAQEENVYQSDFVVLDSPGHDDSPQHHHFYLRVTGLPDPITEEELREFFQDRRQSGGGPVAKVELNCAERSAAVFFVDADVIPRVVQRMPLLLKEKMIHAEPASTEHREAETEKKTVEIRGLQDEDETELCTYYFENPAKGGGDIEDSHWNEQEKIFYITFKDPKVAESVSSKGHKPGGKVLEVTLYTPPVDELEDGQPQCTVEVRGVDPAKIDLYEMYFSNPRKGGDNIADLSMNEDQTVMYITFETPEVAERVAAAPHKVGGRQLEVTVAPVEVPTPPSTVLIKGGDLSRAELYQLYFENPNKGGGEIIDYKVDEEQQSIFITFQDPEVAQAVVTKQHKVGGHNLELSLCTPKKATPIRQRSHDLAEEEEEKAPPRTVVVTLGQHPVESEETYTLYFESPRYGGAEVEVIDIDKEKKLVYVTFAEPEVAARVAQKQHKIAGHPVEVELYVPPKPRPTYPGKLLFKNVADSTSRDCLSLYLQHATDLEPQEILYGDENGTVLVTFEQEPDLGKTSEMLRKRKLEGRQLTVSKVPISNCLLVENLCSMTTEDTVALYFENKRSNGGPVERLEMAADGNKCLVYFESHEVLDGVLSKQHKIDGSQLVVKRYMECLGPSGGSKDPTAFTMPKPLMLDINPYQMAFLHQSPAAKTGLAQELSQNYAQTKFVGDSLILECILTPAVPKARILARTWAVDAKEAMESYLKLIEIHRREVMQGLWQEVVKAVRAAQVTSTEGAVLFTLSEETAFVVVGTKSMAKELFDKVCAIAKAKEEEIERRNMEVTEVNSKLQLYQLRLLQAFAFHIEAGKRHDGLKIDIQCKKNCIVFHGMAKDVKEAQIEMYELLQMVKSGKITDMSDIQRKLLENKEMKPYIVQKFKNDKISAIWEAGQQDEISVFAFDDKSLVRAIHIIKTSVPEHVCHLSPESSELLSCQDWKHLISHFTSTNPGALLIAPSHDHQQVFIACMDSIMHGVVEDVERFLEENTIYSQVVRFSRSRQTFVHQNWQPKLSAIAERLKAYKVQINMKESEMEIYVKGTKKGLEEAQRSLEHMNGQILCHTQVFSDQGYVKFLNTDCEKDLLMIGRSYHCVLAKEPEPAGLQVESSSHAATSPLQVSSNTATSIQLPKGESVTVMQGDITMMTVDVIVNAANARMDHVGGLARDIVEKGGRIIQDECYKILKHRGNQLKEGDVLVSGSGRLPCKAVIHAVGPMYKGGHSGEEECLFDTVVRCLEMASSDGHQSIAIPAISTGIFGYPSGESTQVIVEAVKTYLDTKRRSTIRSVYFCHTGADIVQLFARAVQKTFPSANSTTTVKKNPLSVPRKGTTFSKPQLPIASGGTARTHRVINVSIIPGEIAKQTADVIVNSASNGLDLQNGAVSSSILKVAGTGLQNECRTKYPNGIQTGSIARTLGHGLRCSEIFHLALSNFSNPGAQQMLGQVVTKCMAEASKQHYTSIVFPVLGTGNLGYPAPIVAETMLGAIDQFQGRTPSTTLKDVRIVVYPTDKKNLQEFQKVQSGMGGSFVPVAPTHRLIGARQDRIFSESAASPVARVPATSSSICAEFDIGGLRFVIKKGDITEENTDVIVNSTNSQLDLSRGAVAGALRRKCGPALEHDCTRKADEIRLQGVVQTKAHNLRSKVIFHVDADRYSDNWEEGIIQCLKVAEKNDVRSIAMPALGTGIGLSPGASASALFNAVVTMYATKKGCVQEVRVVLFDQKLIPGFVSAVQAKGEKHNKSNKGFFNFIKSAFTGSAAEVKQTVNYPMLEEVTLYIYAEKQADIDLALKSFDELVKDKFTHKEVRDDLVMSLEPEEMQRMERIALAYNVELKIQQWTGCIILDGLHHACYDCVHEISNALRDIDRKRQQKQAAAMLANMIQWCYLEVITTGTESKEYQSRENHIIETAFQNKEKCAKIEDQKRNVYIIDFDAMMEYPQVDPTDVVSVIRRDKIKDLATGQVPEHWEKHGPDEMVKLVPLAATGSDYKDVEDSFKLTVPNVNITAISRVQNPHLYHQYVAKKAHLEKQNPGTQNEKSLWHGTSSDAIQNINHHGFNRSFCGKNATAYGQGVYFAVNANYSASATYSPPDPAGNRHVYLCKVLVGIPTKGNSAMRVLPTRQGHILYDSATDNPSSPGMFVIFNDTQAYPEYLITFK